MALYSTAKAFIFPSLFEGFGLPILEAMACGCPVICSNAASLPEIGGTACLYFNPLVPEEIVAHIQQVNQPQLRTQLATASLQQAATFSWEQTAQRTLEVFRNCLWV